MSKVLNQWVTSPTYDMNETKQIKYLDEHIPYRLTAIDGLCWTCDMLRRPDSFVEVRMKDTVIKSNTYRLLTNPFLEIGCIFCRVMLEFLGIGFDNNKKRLVNRSDSQYRALDVSLKDFVSHRITAATLYDSSLGTPREIEDACIETILVAHKGVAHLTDEALPPPDLIKLRLGAETVLLNQGVE
ncbi:hypothetical protein ACFLQR_04345, partial [Verrucomicrobiota bacterium]